MKASAQLARSLEDVQTELLIQSFSDRILVLITQVGKVGSLIQASITPTVPLLPSSDSPFSNLGHTDEAEASDANSSLPPPPPSIQLIPLLGVAPTEHSQTLHSLYASQVATIVWLSEESYGGERKPVVVGIALKKLDMWDESKERRTFMGVMRMLKELLGQESR